MDTIFALASAPGKAGVSIIRVSGPDAWFACSRLAGRLPEPRVTALRILKDESGAYLDQSVVVLFEAGASFTGERVAEFHVHGSVAVVRAVLATLGRINGLRLATAGEFTRRALENGCLDLTQVEALADLIESETEAQRKQALAILEGALSRKVEEWRAGLVRAAALIAVTIDFADEEVPTEVSDEVLKILTDVRASVTSELSGLDAAERIRSGFEVAIVGPPNAGKSTLLNFLAGREAAITSNVAGTTRDVIEVRMEVYGFAVTFLDTAGLRDTDDAVERIGVARARSRAEAADVRIHLVERGEEPLLPVLPGDFVLVPQQDDGSDDGISGLTGAGVDRLLRDLRDVLAERVSEAGVASQERHRANLSDCIRALDSAEALLVEDPEASDVVSEDLRMAIRSLETLVGKVDVEDLLDEIFSSFCIGK